MGVEIPAPLVNDATRAANFTNEGGVNNTIRLLKNVMGLWLVQEIRRDYARKGSEYSYEALVLQAREAEPFRSIVDPDDASFILPSSMTHAFSQYCRKSGQPAPETPGAFVRCALESLALRYRWVLGKLEELTGKPIETIHIVGGGCQNALLNQFTADACQRQVLAGPVEATALGNIMTQAMGLRLVSNLTQAREVIRNSFGLTTFDPAPNDKADWEKAWSKFQGLIG
jgi:rhamnulokinase